MHLATNSVKCTFRTAESESDVVGVCGTCGSKRGIRQWVPLEVEAIQSWPTLGLKSRSQFKLCAAGRKDLKGKAKGNGKFDVGPIHRPVDSDQVPFLWFLLGRQRTVLPQFKVQVMSLTSCA